MEPGGGGIVSFLFFLESFKFEKVKCEILDLQETIAHQSVPYVNVMYLIAFCFVDMKIMLGSVICYRTLHI